MQISVNDIFNFLLAFFGGGGLGCLTVKLLIRNEAKEALKEDFRKIEKSIEEIKKDIGKMTSEYVTCKYCNMQHENLNVLLKSMDDKLDVLIERH